VAADRINHPLGKNMIGAFYQPKVVLADTDTLKTLPHASCRRGWRGDQVRAIWMPNSSPGWKPTWTSCVRSTPRRSPMRSIARARSGAVWGRTSAKRIRAILNLGHTFGHAIEPAWVTATG